MSKQSLNLLCKECLYREIETKLKQKCVLAITFF